MLYVQQMPPRLFLNSASFHFTFGVFVVVITTATVKCEERFVAEGRHVLYQGFLKDFTRVTGVDEVNVASVGSWGRQGGTN